jgi:hypothetical protein
VACFIDPHDIASGQTQRKTPFLVAGVLQYDVAVAVDPQKTPLPGVASLLCDSAVTEKCHCLTTCLDFEQISHNIVQSVSLNFCNDICWEGERQSNPFA